MADKPTMLNVVWLTKKRKVMLAILATFVAGSSVYKVAARGSDEIRQSQPNNGVYVKAGSWGCPDPMAAVNIFQLKQNSSAWRSLSQYQNNIGGCVEAPGKVRVSVLDNTSVGSVEVVKVGTSGGTFWVLPSDLEQ